MDQGSSPIQTPTPELGVAGAVGGGAVARAHSISNVHRGSKSIALRDYAGSFMFVVPYLLFFLAFVLGPLVYALFVSTHRWTTVGGNLGFVGLRYYKALFDPSTLAFQDFWLGMRHTVLFVVITVPLLVALSLSLALLLANGPFRNFFRAVFYVPAVLSVTVACTIWLWIFQPGGIVNIYTHSGIQWLTTEPWAWITIIVATLWWTVGFNMVVLLAGVQEVPNDYHEAAKIDGANAWQRVWKITIPLLRPILAFITITQMLASFGLFGQVYILTQGGPTRSTEPVILTILNTAFTGDQNLALACAMSFVMAVILIFLAILQIKFFKVGEA